MSLYEQQIRSRIKNDDDQFQSAFARMVGVVMGKKVADAMNNQRQVTKNAIDEILKYYGFKTQDIPADVRTLDEMLEYQLRPSGIMRSAVRLEKGWRNTAVGPMIAVRKDTGGIVALLPAFFFGYRYYENGVLKAVTRRNEDLFEEEAILFYRPLPNGKITPRALLRFATASISRADLGAIAAATGAVTLLGLLLPALSDFMIAEVIPTDSISLLVSTAIFFLCTAVAIPLIEAVKELLVSRVSSKADMATQAAMYMRLLNLPLSFFREHSAGELTNRMKMIGDMCAVMTDAVLDSALTAAFSLVYVAQIFTYAPALALPTLAVLLVSALFTAAAAVRKVQQMDVQLEYKADVAGFSFGMISGIQKIKLAGAEKRAFARWADNYAKIEDVRNNPGVLVKYRNVISEAVRLAGMFWLYAAAIRTRMGASEYYAFFVAYSMVTAAFANVADVSFAAAQIKPVLRMIGPILNTEPETHPEKGTIGKLSGSIELSHVTFRYSQQGPTILDDLDLRIRPGEYVAIVGYTGCGKSTLMRVMLGFETPQTGAVYFDRKDISGYDLRSLRRSVGIVNQNGDLFAGNIFQNIAFSVPGLTEQEAWEAAEMSGLAEDIRNMPLGMDTHISEGTGGLSGGQRQRIIIARAIASKPKVLMFDEATSALDNISQKLVSESLAKLNCTRIVIAHRLSTIRHCDRIVFLHQGKIVEDGSYDQLIEKNGYFADLVRRQQV